MQALPRRLHARRTAGRRLRARTPRLLRAPPPGPPCAGSRAAMPRAAHRPRRERRSGRTRRASDRAPRRGTRRAADGRALRPRRARFRAAPHAARRRLPTRALCRSRTGAGRPLRRGLLGDRRSRALVPSAPRGRRGAGATFARRSPSELLGSVTSTGSRSTDPWGGERPTGSWSRTGSRTSRPAKRSTRAGRRIAYCVRRAGPVTTTRATAARPISAVSGLRSIASIRSEPHHQPPSASPSASSANRARGACRRHDGGEDRQRRDGERPAPVSIGGRDPRAEARQQQVGNVEREPPDHGTTSSRSSSIVAGPIPGTASSSSTERNAPCAVR